VAPADPHGVGVEEGPSNLRDDGHLHISVFNSPRSLMIPSVLADGLLARRARHDRHAHRLAGDDLDIERAHELDHALA